MSTLRWVQRVMRAFGWVQDGVETLKPLLKLLPKKRPKPGPEVEPLGQPPDDSRSK